MAHKLRVDPAVFETFPDYRALILYTTGMASPESDDASLEIQRQAMESARAAFGDAKANSHEHMMAWRKTFSAFGSKPSKYPNSGEALLKRVLRGDDLPQINYMVDVYNALSVKYVIPLGGEDRDKLTSDLVLRFATGDEPFVTRGDGEVEHPDEGEVVWADSDGVTCRRWNWRQGERTALTTATRNAYFLFETLKPYSMEMLQAACDEFVEHVKAVSPDCGFETEVLEA